MSATEPSAAVAGIKHDTQKPRWSLLPAGTVRAIVEILEFGAAKYAANNWQRVPEARQRYYDALMRHVQAWWDGERLDAETGRPHLAHAGCCLLFLLWFDLQQQLADTPAAADAVSLPLDPSDHKPFHGPWTLP